jgi:hypothetical protein
MNGSLIVPTGNYPSFPNVKLVNLFGLPAVV